MYKHCSTEESARRQREFEQCLLELMQAVPYAQITISDICERMKLSRKSFYRYFSSKDGCLYALIDHSILEFASRYLPDDSLTDLELYEHYFSYWKKLNPLLNALSLNRLAPVLYERTMRSVAEENHELWRFLDSNGQNDGYERILYGVCGITGVLLNWHDTGYRKSPRQMAATIVRLMSPAGSN